VLEQATGNTYSLNSSRPGLEGSHHLPPYKYFLRLPTGPTSEWLLSQDSQGGVPKLSQFGLPGLWELITPSSDLQLGWGLKQTCSSPQELSNGVLHYTWTHRDWVDSWLVMVGSHIASLTPGPSFNHYFATNVQMAHATPFWTSTLQDLSNGMKNTSMQGVLTPTIKL
jgi:hypothetical protein